jgi:signal transduction histidine kinase/ActR/RegA family two-component response regulator
MSESPPTGAGDGDGARELHRCIRDLAALTALPSMCIGRSPAEALDLVLDALPTALSCDLVYLVLPGSPAVERAMLYGAPVSDDKIPALAAAIGRVVDAAGPRAVPGASPLWYLEAEVPLGAETGRLVAGRGAPLASHADRVLVRGAANLVGTALENARVLENARSKDEFLAVLGHELRNPLAPILTAVELMRLRAPGSVQREVTVVERQAQHLVRLVEDLLDVSRIARGKLELKKERIELAEAVTRAIEQASPIIEQRKHDLKVQVSRAGLLLEADPDRLAQVIANLLTNAAKYTEAGGRITITATRTADQMIELKVRDTGIGIAPEMLPIVFDRFVQERQALDRSQGGLGLGLAIVRSFVTLHGGSVSAHSAGRGQGSEFTVLLPALDVQSAPASPSAAASLAKKPPSAGLRILLVDDNEDYADMLAKALAARGNHVRVAHNGPAALRIANEFAPEIAILDIGLPVMDGYELAQLLRKRTGGDALRLVAVTGYGQEGDKHRAQEAGFDAHLAKPVDADRVESVIRDLTATHSTVANGPTLGCSPHPLHRAR